jgi:hypothetical protein
LKRVFEAGVKPTGKSVCPCIPFDMRSLTRGRKTPFGGTDIIVDELKAQALRLDPEARVDLARELLASLDGSNEAEVEGLWIDEAMRRHEKLDSGAARVYPAAEVLERAGARRG